MTNFLLETDIQQIVENLSDVSLNFSGKRILLTGGRGFLGRYFCEIFHRYNKPFKPYDDIVPNIKPTLFMTVRHEDLCVDYKQIQDTEKNITVWL